MKNKLIMAALLVASVAAWGAGQGQTPTPAASPSAKASTGDKNPSEAAAEGEKRFVQHCGRCHTPPSSISPRIAGTVLRHMRIRASLSREDEQYILRFLAPGMQP